MVSVENDGVTSVSLLIVKKLPGVFFMYKLGAVAGCMLNEATSHWCEPTCPCLEPLFDLFNHDEDPCDLLTHVTFDLNLYDHGHHYFKVMQSAPKLHFLTS